MNTLLMCHQSKVRAPYVNQKVAPYQYNLHSGLNDQLRNLHYDQISQFFQKNGG